MFAPRERRPFEVVVEVDPVLEDVVDTLCQLLRHQGAGDSGQLLPFPALVPVPDFGEVLNGPHRGMAEGELEIPIAVLAGPVPLAPAESAAPGTSRQSDQKWRAMGNRTMSSTSRGIVTATLRPMPGIQRRRWMAGVSNSSPWTARSSE